MDLNDEQLQTVYDMAYRLFTPKDIAIAMALPVDEFVISCQVQDSPVSKKYFEGRYQQTAEIREALIRAAKNGSNPAQEQLLALLLEHNDELVI